MYKLQSLYTSRERLYGARARVLISIQVAESFPTLSLVLNL